MVERASASIQTLGAAALHRREFLQRLMLLCVASSAKADVAPVPRAATSAGLQSDVDILGEALRTLHPGLYRYNTPAQVDAHLSTLRSSLDHARGLREAFLALSEFTATIKCGHTYPNFYNQIEAVQRTLFQATNRVPFYFRWLDGRMIVTRNLAGDGVLRPGCEIAAINQVPTKRILDHLLRIARADGSNDAKRVAYLEVQGFSRYEAFDIFLPSVVDDVGARLSFDVIDLGGRRMRHELPAFSDAQRLAFRPSEEERSHASWTLAYSGEDVAILTMPSWAVYASSWDWRGFIESTFAELAQRPVGSLVIDIRANEGGDDVGSVLVSHLIDTDLAPSPYRRLVRYRRVPESLQPFLDTWDPAFRDWGDRVVAEGGGFYRLKSAAADGSENVIKPLLPRFAGRVILLTSAVNSSAAFQFAQTMKLLRNATLIGEPTGGNRRGLNGGAFFFLRLPNSRIEVDIPLIGTFPEAAQPDAGIEPDSIVCPTAADIADGVDVVMLAALSVARKARSS